ncbi:MarR family winged helix-turn-helix transcriptional regulator [Neisseria iguanae]|uniref:MarR family transcriptional regulator n=1 Tax=Neisseria iguanae TaxID=90242 RepID=A0A2P7TX46_9NEIS|nr:MarR family winged helix-turn-helix transcriptional regulator [Neisseria iguanae]PSJ79291.1 MarR family transcriptional regulator [Neisseria iguanae]
MNFIDDIGRLMAHSTRLYEQWAKRHGLSYNMLAVLYGVAYYPDCTQKTICTHWNLPKQTVFSACRQLAEQGWLTFFPDPNDKRGKTLHLTETGQAAALPVIRKIHDLEQGIIRDFGEAQAEAFIQQLQRFIQIVARHTQEP